MKLTFALSKRGCLPGLRGRLCLVFGDAVMPWAPVPSHRGLPDRRAN